MRISIEETDPGYLENAYSMKIEVLCDGVVVENCITADEEHGIVWYWIGGDGHPRMKEHKHGKIEIHGDFP